MIPRPRFHRPSGKLGIPLWFRIVCNVIAISEAASLVGRRGEEVRCSARLEMVDLLVGCGVGPTRSTTFCILWFISFGFASYILVVALCVFVRLCLVHLRFLCVCCVCLLCVFALLVIYASF